MPVHPCRTCDMELQNALMEQSAAVTTRKKLQEIAFKLLERLFDYRASVKETQTTSRKPCCL